MNFVLQSFKVVHKYPPCKSCAQQFSNHYFFILFKSVDRKSIVLDGAGNMKC